MPNALVRFGLQRGQRRALVRSLDRRVVHPAFPLMVGVWLRPYVPRYLLGRGAGPGPSGGAGW
jgi:hypothetical protein